MAKQTNKSHSHPRQELGEDKENVKENYSKANKQKQNELRRRKAGRRE